MMNKNKGFTLIETIIYIALFSLLMGSAFVVTYELIDGSDELSAKITTQEEGNFMLRKINYALTGISSLSNTTNTLQANKYHGNQINIRLTGTKIEIKESTNGNTFIPITTDNVKVTNLNFVSIPELGEAPAGVTATFTIDGTDFTITKYIRK